MSDMIVRNRNAAVVIGEPPPAMVIEVYALTPFGPAGPTGPVGPMGPTGPVGPTGANGFIPEPVGAGTWGRAQPGVWLRTVAIAGDTMAGPIVLTADQIIDGGVF